ncbi:kinase-like domain-containing protein [Mariannaea sp. PMI_226]|nr:kinase-like domain-containing protein [Mariannaea sp. PMI_226]
MPLPLSSFGVDRYLTMKFIRTRKISQYQWASNLARMWENEVSIHHELDHPAIIKLQGSDARFLALYREYSECHDLCQWRDKKNNFKGGFSDTRRILIDVASALEYLNDKGIVHNDIKPSNILYKKEVGARLIDFGLASRTNDKTLCLGGTPWYVAPEYMQRKRGPKSDMFGLGVTFLFLLRAIPLPDATRTYGIFSISLNSQVLLEPWQAG